MRKPTSRFSIGLLVVFAAITLSLGLDAQAQTIRFLTAQSPELPPRPPALIQATDGNFYSVHYTVLHQVGEVFRMTPAGKVTPVYAFCSQIDCPDGSVALNPLLGSDGNLYGVANFVRDAEQQS
jgi:hypothetical protein